MKNCVDHFKEDLRAIINCYQIAHQELELKIDISMYLNPLDYDGIDNFDLIFYSQINKFDHETSKLIPKEKQILFQCSSCDIDEIIEKLNKFVRS